MILTVEKIQKFLIGHFGVQSVFDLGNVNIDGSYVIPIDDYEFNVIVKDKKLFKEEMTPESKKLYNERKAHGEKMEKIAAQLAPGEENYCWHEDKRVVYYGGDWEEEDESHFFTEHDLTDGLKETKKRLKAELIESRKNVRLYSVNDIIKIYKANGDEKFITALEKDLKKKYKKFS